MLSVLLASAIVTVGGCSSARDAGFTCASVLRGLAPVTNTGARRATSTIVVDGANAAFSPTCITGVPHGVVTMTVRNTGEVLHNVAIASQHIDVDIARGRAVSIRVRMGSQPVVFVCKYHRSLGMVGVLIPAP